MEGSSPILCDLLDEVLRPIGNTNRTFSKYTLVNPDEKVPELLLDDIEEMFGIDVGLRLTIGKVIARVEVAPTRRWRRPEFTFLTEDEWAGQFGPGRYQLENDLSASSYSTVVANQFP